MIILWSRFRNGTLFENRIFYLIWISSSSFFKHNVECEDIADKIPLKCIFTLENCFHKNNLLHFLGEFVSQKPQKGLFESNFCFCERHFFNVLSGSTSDFLATGHLNQQTNQMESVAQVTYSDSLHLPASFICIWSLTEHSWYNCGQVIQKCCKTSGKMSSFLRKEDKMTL